MIPTFDIEALEWVIPIAVGFFDGEEYHEFFKLGDDCDVIRDFLEYLGKNHQGVKLFAHNAANYDNKFILSTLTTMGEEVEFLAGMGCIKWVRTGIQFEDSYLLLGRSLASCCAAFGVDSKLAWDHNATKNPWEMSNENKLDEFRQYLKRDCLALSEVLEKFSYLLLENFEVVPSSTLALTAAKAFNKNFYNLRDIHPNEEVEVFIRKATYGGRNEVYKRYGERVNFYDVRKMYMSCYDVPVPIGKLRWASKSMDRGIVAEAWVKIPKGRIGPLPYRYKNRLVFPTGELRGWWDLRELRAATKYGVDVHLIRVLDGDEAPILKEFGDVVGTLIGSSNPDLARIWKLFGLRLSGKFGQHKTNTVIRHVKYIAPEEYNPIDPLEVYHEVPCKEVRRKSPYIKPAINMRIRAEARIRHLEKMSQVEDLYYCDTDSIYTTNEMATGLDIGKLRLVDFALRAYFIGGKLYGYVNSNGELKQKTAGYRDYPLSEDDFQKLLRGGEIPCHYRRLGNWKSVLKQGEFLLDEVSFTYRNPSTSNRIMGELETYPIEVMDKMSIFTNGASI